MSFLPSLDNIGYLHADERYLIVHTSVTLLIPLPVIQSVTQS